LARRSDPHHGRGPDPTLLPADRAGLVRWGALTDMLGFYLLSVPVTLHLDDASQDPATPSWSSRRWWG
jgi:hypothetical protein